MGNILNKIPGSLEIVIRHATSGVFMEILLWALFVVYVIFLYYVISYFIKKR